MACVLRVQLLQTFPGTGCLSALIRVRPPPRCSCRSVSDTDRSQQQGWVMMIIFGTVRVRVKCDGCSLARLHGAVSHARTCTAAALSASTSLRDASLSSAFLCVSWAGRACQLGGAWFVSWAGRALSVGRADAVSLTGASSVGGRSSMGSPPPPPLPALLRPRGSSTKSRHHHRRPMLPRPSAR
eukprot:COSAG01_NODE_5017_length_4524_cov_3.064836_7_plen_184_part_00